MKNDDTSAKMELLESLFSEAAGPAVEAAARVPDLASFKDGPEATVRILVEHIAELRRKNAECVANEELARLQLAQMKKLRESEAKLKDEVTALSDKLAKLAEKTENDQRTIAQLTAKTTIAEATDGAQREQLNELESENEQLHQQAVVNRQSIEDLKKRVAELESQAEAEKREASESLKRVQGDSNRKLAQIADASWEKEIIIGELRKEQNELKNRLASLQIEAETSAQNYRKVSEELSVVRVELAGKDAELAKLQSRFEYELKVRDARADRSGEVEAQREARAEYSRELSRVKADAQQEISALKGERSRLEKALAEAEGHVAALRREILKGQTELEQARLQAEQTIQAKSNEFANRLNIREQEFLKQLNAQEQEFTRQMNSKEFEMQGALEQAEAKMRVLEAQKHTAENQIRSEMMVRQAEFAQALNAKEMRLQEILHSREALEREIKRVSENEQKKIDELERAETRARAMEDTLRAELMKVQAESSSMAAQLTVTREQLGQLRDEQRRTVLDLETAAKTIVGLREALIERQGEIQAAKDAGARDLLDFKTSMHREIADARGRAEIFEAQVSEARAKIRQLESSLERAEREIGERETRVAALNKEIEAKSRALAEERSRGTEVSSQLELRENQLRVYAGVLGKEKAEMQKAAKQLVKEIRMLSSTHPLKDYVAATEFELSKVEVQLKTTPTLAGERVKLEEYLAKLVEQRDFLKGVLSGSQRQFEAQAGELEKMLSSSALAPVPPPPPSPVAKAGTAAPAGAVSRTMAVEPRWEKPFDHIA